LADTSKRSLPPQRGAFKENSRQWIKINFPEWSPEGAARIAKLARDYQVEQTFIMDTPTDASAGRRFQRPRRGDWRIWQVIYRFENRGKEIPRCQDFMDKYVRKSG